jgi:hypothetical protein
MNTIDATPKFHFGVRGTLVPQRYPFVNVLLRTNTRAREMRLGNVVCDEQSIAEIDGVDRNFPPYQRAHRGT